MSDMGSVAGASVHAVGLTKHLNSVAAKHFVRFAASIRDLLGPSGSGKTTTLMIAGFEFRRARSSSTAAGGRSRHGTISAWSSRTMHVPHMTVFDNVIPPQDAQSPDRDQKQWT